jgi:hypothetical protein
MRLIKRIGGTDFYNWGVHTYGDVTSVQKMQKSSK